LDFLSKPRLKTEGDFRVSSCSGFARAMKSGGPWNLSGLRPDAPEAADDAACRAGISVEEWLNTLIQQSRNDSGALMRQPDSKNENHGTVGRPDEPPEPDNAATHGSQRPQRHNREYEREHVLAREASLAREEFDDVHSRLDKLTSQLERIARGDAPGRDATPQYLGAEHAGRAPLGRGPLPSVSASTGSHTSIDLAGLERQLRHLTSRIESLQPAHDCERLIAAFRDDLLDIGRQITQALPRQAVDSLGQQVEALAERIDHSRQSGVDTSIVAAIERGLSEVRDALHRLTTAESLVGFDESINALAQKVDLIIARQDPAALQQLETAIGALRGIVSHVASSDALNRVAEDVRVLGIKVDALASSAASGRAVSALECRIDTLASAMHASATVGHAAPRELEKLDRGRLSQIDHGAFHRLEDRIALLIKRLDASDAQLGNLQSIERDIADLLVHIDSAHGRPAIVEAIARDVAEIKCSEQRTQDSLEAVHGAVEQLVNRLAMIEGDIRDASKTAEARSDAPAISANAKPPKPAPEPALNTAAPSMPVGASVGPLAAAAPVSRADTRRLPIDPTLPPDHPLEPGSAAGLRSPSVVEHIAAFEPVSGAPNPPPAGEVSDRQDFIAAARRAVQAAAAPSSREVRSESRRRRSSRKSSATGDRRPSHARKLLAGAGVVLLTVGCLEIVLHMLQGERLAIEAPAVTERPLPSPAVPEADSTALAPTTGSVAVPAPSAPSNTAPSAPSNKLPDSETAAPVVPNGNGPPLPPALPQALSLAPASITVSTLLAPTPAAPASSSSSGPASTHAPAPTPAPTSVLAPQPSAHRSADITGTLPSRVPPPALALPISAAPAPSGPPQSETSQASVTDSAAESLPVTIGGPTLRAAAIAGDTAAEFEIALRFAQGRGVPADQQQAARWLELAAQQGLAPAQFRLGGFYEKGIGVQKDLAEARRLYLEAAAKGNGKAMHNLAVLYAEGINGPADYRAAALWFHKAAERGITDSQYNLGILYERGSGEPQNDAEAYKWFALAADRGDSEAANKRDEIASELDEQTLEAAELAVKAFRPEPQPDDAINVKTPPGGWDVGERGARAKVPLPVAKPAVPESKTK
jgi:localization factor PodJL